MSKSNQEFSMEVVPYRPYHRFFVVLAFLGITLVLVVAAYYMGYYNGSKKERAAENERDELLSYSGEKTAEVERLQQQVANLTMGSEIDRQANVEVRTQVVALKNRIAELERDNTFYRDLMSPKDKAKGILMGEPIITSSDNALEFKYSLIIKQLVANHKQVKGYIEFILVGKEAGKAKTIALKDVSDNVSVDKIKLNFKYFQRIEGKILLPVAFTPERIELKLVSTRPKKRVIEKPFSWTVKES